MLRDTWELVEFRKGLVERKTKAEVVFEKALREHVKARLNCQMILGFYIADFFYRKKNLIIEVDGRIHETPKQKLHDERRDAYFEGLGFTVLRFTNEQVLQDLDNCILEVLKYPNLGREFCEGNTKRVHLTRKHAFKRFGDKDWIKR